MIDGKFKKYNMSHNNGYFIKPKDPSEDPKITMIEIQPTADKLELVDQKPLRKIINPMNITFNPKATGIKLF